MPTEYRRLTFSFDELIDALVSYDRHADQRLTCGTVVAARIDADESAYVGLDVRLHGATTTVSIPLSPEYVGASLIFFCLKAGIPVPRNAERFLACDSESVSICFFIGEHADEGMIALPAYFAFNPRSVQLQFS
jgi:hypothetical protein